MMPKIPWYIKYRDISKKSTHFSTIRYHYETCLNAYTRHEYWNWSWCSQFRRGIAPVINFAADHRYFGFACELWWLKRYRRRCTPTQYTLYGLKRTGDGGVAYDRQGCGALFGECCQISLSRSALGRVGKAWRKTSSHNWRRRLSACIRTAGSENIGIPDTSTCRGFGSLGLDLILIIDYISTSFMPDSRSIDYMLYMKQTLPNTYHIFL